VVAATNFIRDVQRRRSCAAELVATGRDALPVRCLPNERLFLEP
jgi:hypothetical protein